MRTIVTIEARMGSSRLPGKVLEDILGKPVLEHLIDRLRRARLPDAIVVATTVNPLDDAIEALCRRIGCDYHRGSEPDITSRLIATAKASGADLIAQTTGDCPLLDPEVVDEGIRLFRDSAVDYVSNRLERSYPCGQDVQVFPLSVLERVAASTSDPNDREHGSYYIYTHPREFAMRNFLAPDGIRCPEKRWVLDYPEDLEFMRRVYGALYPANPAFTTREVLAWLRAHPEAEAINAMHPIDTTPYPHWERLPPPEEPR